MNKILSKVFNNKYCNAVIAIFAFIGTITIIYSFLKTSMGNFNIFIEFGLGYGCCFVAAARGWVKLVESKYFTGCGFLLYSVMYFLYLYENFGASHPHVSAIGFSAATLVVFYAEKKGSDKKKKRDNA